MDSPGLLVIFISCCVCVAWCFPILGSLPQAFNQDPNLALVRPNGNYSFFLFTKVAKDRANIVQIDYFGGDAQDENFAFGLLLPLLYVLVIGGCCGAAGRGEQERRSRRHNVLLWIYCSSKISRQKMSSVVHGQCSVLLLSSSPSSFCMQDITFAWILAMDSLSPRHVTYPTLTYTVPYRERHNIIMW